jgi:hypothetical protein
MNLGFGAYGIAWAVSIVSVVEVAILFVIMARRIPKLFDAVFIHAVFRMMSAAGFMAIVTYVLVLLLPLRGGEQSFFTTFPQFAFITGGSLAAYTAICMLLKLEEPVPVVRSLRTILFGRAGDQK